MLRSGRPLNHCFSEAGSSYLGHSHPQHTQFPENLVPGLEAPPSMRQVTGLFTKCSVLTSLLLTYRLPSIGSPDTEMQPLLPFWAAGTDRTGCHYHGRSWLSQETMALLLTAWHSLLQTAAGNRDRGFGRLLIVSAGHLVQGGAGVVPHPVFFVLKSKDVLGIWQKTK